MSKNKNNRPLSALPNRMRDASQSANQRLLTDEEAAERVRILYVSTRYARDVPDCGPDIAGWHMHKLAIYQELLAYFKGCGVKPCEPQPESLPES